MKDIILYNLKTSKVLIGNFDYQNIREIVRLATETSRQRHLEQKRYKVEEEVLITNQISKTNPKKRYFKNENQKH